MLNDRLRHPGKLPGVGWPEAGEIDIMENVGYDPPGFHFSLHSKNYNWQRKEQRTNVIRVPDPLAFHRFGLDWRRDSIKFYYDGKAVYTVKRADPSFAAWPYTDPYYCGRLAIPKAVRDSLHITAGDRFVVQASDDGSS
jgi:AbrB family looped-hinge helix DNA binding protein